MAKTVSLLVTYVAELAKINLTLWVIGTTSEAVAGLRRWHSSSRKLQSLFYIIYITTPNLCMWCVYTYNVQHLMCIYIYVCICTHACLYIYMCVCVCIHVSVCIYVCIHVHMYVYVYKPERSKLTLIETGECVIEYLK